MTEKAINFGVLAVTGLLGVVVGGFASKVYYQDAPGSSGSASLADISSISELNTDEQKQAYSLGVIMGTQAGSTVSLNKDRINTNFVLAGFKDKLEEADLKLEDTEVRASLQQLQLETSKAAQDQMKAKKVELEAKAVEKQAGLFIKDNQPQFGKGDITIVEFFDYNCSHCRALNPKLVELVSSDSNINIVYRPVGLVTKSSQLAAKAALAAQKQNKFKELHNALMSEKGEITQEVLDKITASVVGLDKSQFSTDLASPEVDGLAKANMKIFMELGLGGVPSLFVAKLDENNKVSQDNLEFLLDYRPASIQEAVTKLK